MRAILGIEVDGESFGAELGHEAVESVLYYIPDTEENAGIFAALAKHPFPRVRERVAEKRNLDQETLMKLAEDTDPRVVASVAYSEGFKEEASLDQLKKIMEKEDEQYYNIYFELFRSDGWRQLTEELTEVAAHTNNVAIVKDAQDLFFRQGQLDILTWLLKFEDSINNNYEDLVETDD